MGTPKAIVFCGKCGNSMVMGTFPIVGSVQTRPCRFCIQTATREGYNAGRMSAIMDLYEEPKDDLRVAVAEAMEKVEE